MTLDPEFHEDQAMLNERRKAWEAAYNPRAAAIELGAEVLFRSNTSDWATIDEETKARYRRDLEAIYDAMAPLIRQAAADGIQQLAKANEPSRLGSHNETDHAYYNGLRDAERLVRIWPAGAAAPVTEVKR